VTIIGDYNNHECAIRLSPITEYDNGLWKCEIEEYITRINIFATTEKTSHLFNVTVIPGRKKKDPTAQVTISSVPKKVPCY